jgi:hypothetical protein
MTDLSIKDIIYFDFDKSASIYSQFHGGLRESLSLTEDKTKERTLGAKLGLTGIAEAKFGTDYINATSIIESKVLHHDLLNEIEQDLNQQKLIADLNKEVDSSVTSPEDIRLAIGEKPYILAEGWSVIEDYSHIRAITEVFNKIIEFISHCAESSIKQSPEYLKIQQALDEKREEIKGITDRNQRALAKSQLSGIENQLKATLTPKLTQVDDWQIAGIQKFIDTFMPNRINFRIYPFESCPSFQIICNLKRGCFIDQDLEHLLYGYSNRPTVRLAVFGLITSIPSKTGHKFDPMSEFESEDKLSDKLAFEKAFRSIFGAMDELEDWMRYSRYPNITIHPLAVFRQFHLNI